MSSRDELEKLTAIKLREIAKEYEQITGASGMKKEALVNAILEARGEPLVEVNKDEKSIARIKQQIRQTLKQRDSALAEKDRTKVSAVRKTLKRLKRQTRMLAGKKPKK
jgi:FlaA1/EpsC-like NDP-sugar epimerase